MPRFYVLQVPGVEDVWEFFQKHYSSYKFEAKTFGVNRMGDASIDVAGVRHVSLNDRADHSAKMLCREKDLPLITDADVPALVAFILLHEIGHHELGHTQPSYARAATDDPQADNWAEQGYNRLATTGHLPRLPPAKLSEFRRIAGR